MYKLFVILMVSMMVACGKKDDSASVPLIGSVYVGSVSLENLPGVPVGIAFSAQTSSDLTTMQSSSVDFVMYFDEDYRVRYSSVDIGKNQKFQLFMDDLGNPSRMTMPEGEVTFTKNDASISVSISNDGFNETIEIAAEEFLPLKVTLYDTGSVLSSSFYKLKNYFCLPNVSFDQVCSYLKAIEEQVEANNAKDTIEFRASSWLIPEKCDLENAYLYEECGAISFAKKNGTVVDVSYLSSFVNTFKYMFSCTYQDEEKGINMCAQFLINVQGSDSKYCSMTVDGKKSLGINSKNPCPSVNSVAAGRGNINPSSYCFYYGEDSDFAINKQKEMNCGW